MEASKKQAQLQQYLSNYVSLLVSFEESGILKRPYTNQNQTINGIRLDLNMIMKTSEPILPNPMELPLADSAQSVADIHEIRVFLEEKRTELQYHQFSDHSSLQLFVNDLGKELYDKFG